MLLVHKLPLHTSLLLGQRMRMKPHSRVPLFCYGIEAFYQMDKHIYYFISRYNYEERERNSYCALMSLQRSIEALEKWQPASQCKLCLNQMCIDLCHTLLGHNLYINLSVQALDQAWPDNRLQGAITMHHFAKELH